MRWGLVIIVLFATPARADDAVKQAAQLFDAGRQLLAAGDAAGACEKFEQSILLAPSSAGTMLNLGLCNEKLGKFKTSLYWFRKAQARAIETNVPELEKGAREHTTDLAARVASVKIAFAKSPPAGAKVIIDDEEIRPEDYAHVEVDPGHHKLDAVAPDMQIFHHEFDVVDRGGQTLTIAFVPVDPSADDDPGAGRRRLSLYIAIGGAAMLGASAAVSLWAKGRYDHYGEVVPPDPVRQNHYLAIVRYGGTGLLIAGSAAVGVAAYLYFTAPSKSQADRTVWVPAVGPGEIGFAALGRF